MTIMKCFRFEWFRGKASVSLWAGQHRLTWRGRKLREGPSLVAHALGVHPLLSTATG